MVYNIPIFAGVNVNPETLSKLAEIGNIVAVKEEAELNPKQMTNFINSTPDDFIIYCGDDSMVLEAYAQGGTKRIGGIISGASHIIGIQLRKMIEIFNEGNVEEAAKMQQKYLPLFRIMGQNEEAAKMQQKYLPLFRIMGQNGRFNPCALIKEAMKMAGYNSGIPRLPLTPGTEEEIAEVRRVMKELNII
jgi:4-hydroxy-tetrahydrodipicolinate synthase